MTVTKEAKPVKRTGPGRPVVQDIDRHVGARIHERRIMLGISLPHMAELIGVTAQQVHKYEKGANRVAAGRLYAAAQALGVKVTYFFEDMNSDSDFEVARQQRRLLALARSFMSLPNREQQQLVCSLARALASEEDLNESGSTPASS